MGTGWLKVSLFELIPPLYGPQTMTLVSSPANPTLESTVPWYVRHRMRALLLTFAGFLVFGAIMGATAFVMTVNRVKRDPGYAVALARVQESVELQREIGSPIEAGWLATGSSQVAGPADTPFERGEYAFRVHGPEGKAGVRAIAERPVVAEGAVSGDWTLVFLDVGTKSRYGGIVITVVNDKPPVVGADLPEPTPEAKEKYGVEQ